MEEKDSGKYKLLQQYIMEIQILKVNNYSQSMIPTTKPGRQKLKVIWFNNRIYRTDKWRNKRGTEKIFSMMKTSFLRKHYKKTLLYSSETWSFTENNIAIIKKKQTLTGYWVVGIILLTGN